MAEKKTPWFKLPPDDEKALLCLIEAHGVGRLLSALGRIQREKDQKERREARAIQLDF